MYQGLILFPLHTVFLCPRGWSNGDLSSWALTQDDHTVQLTEKYESHLSFSWRSSGTGTHSQNMEEHKKYEGNSRSYKLTVESLYSCHPWGTTFWPLYRGGLYWGVVWYTNCSFGTWVPGRYTEVGFIQGWPLRGVPLNTEVAFIEGLFYNKLFIWDLAFISQLAFLQWWPLINHFYLL